MAANRIVLTVPDTQRDERDHLWPHHLPDGKSILFTVTSTTGGRDAAFVAVLDLKSRGWRPVLRAASQAKYLQSGHLLYVAGEALWIVPFDVSRLQTTGPARVVVPHVLILPTGTAEFAVAPDGTLVYVADTAAPTRRRMVWVDRNGREEEITEAPPRVYAAPRLSPDGSRIALEIADGDHDIWVWDIRRRALTQVTHGAGDRPSATLVGRRRTTVFHLDGGRHAWHTPLAGGRRKRDGRAADRESKDSASDIGACGQHRCDLLGGR